MENEGDMPDYPPLTEDEIKEQKKIEKTINQSRKLSPKVKKQILHIKYKQRNYDAITTRLEEVLDSYLIIGFDNNGNDYVAVKAPTTIDNLALNALIERFVDGHFTALSRQQLENMDEENDDD